PLFSAVFTDSPVSPETAWPAVGAARRASSRASTLSACSVDNVSVAGRRTSSWTSWRGRLAGMGHRLRLARTPRLTKSVGAQAFPGRCDIGGGGGQKVCAAAWGGRPHPRARGGEGGEAQAPSGRAVTARPTH